MVGRCHRFLLRQLDISGLMGLGSNSWRVFFMVKSQAHEGLGGGEDGVKDVVMMLGACG